VGLFSRARRLLAGALALSCALFASVSSPYAEARQGVPGQPVNNTVRVFVGGAIEPSLKASTTFVIAPKHDEKAVIEIHALDPKGSFMVPVGQGLFRTQSGGFSSIPAGQDGSEISMGRPVQIPATLPLEPVDRILVGQTIYVLFSHRGMNARQGEIDSVEITISDPTTGDEELVIAYETGADTGIFAVHMPTTSAGATLRDGALSVAPISRIRATWKDPARENVSLSDDSTVGRVDPFGIVFRSDDGSPVNGAVVELVDAATGEPAQVYGDDLHADYPSTELSR
jgi:hypothetical protein